ncbi:MAG: hypothetical protein QOD48_1624, partial [Gaiellaceae bacterium]|nr:hypothetical protein [Gaiellaceae bacterium]
MPTPLDALSFEPLTPLLFLERAARVFPGNLAVVDGQTRRTYRELRDRTRQFSGALRELGVRPGDRVAVLSSNTPLLLEAHYGVPGCGAVLVALNYRLHASELAQIVAHSGASVVLYDSELAALADDMLRLIPAPPFACSEAEVEARLPEAQLLPMPA